MPLAHLAIDLGASSGRAIVGVLDRDQQSLKLEEVHRFEHLACPTPTGPVWDLTGIWINIREGLARAVTWCRDQNVQLESIGVDTWGVDWALLGKSGELLSLPHCYRDPQNDAACEKVLNKLGGFEHLYRRTGIQLMALNTLFQVAARHEQEPKLFDAAEHLVFLPDLFHYWLSGEITTELSIASTSSMLNVESGDWDRQLLQELGLPDRVLGPIVEPGTIVGMLRKELAEEAGTLAPLKVIAPASHDTASAVAAVPAKGEQGWAYLSSGTWSLLGAELKKPIHTVAAQKAPFTNERGVDGTIRFLMNIAGLWLVQEVQRDLQQSGDKKSFAELVAAARQADSGRTLVDPNYPDFATPGNIGRKIRQFASSTQQPEPETPGQLVRCCLESLALCYAKSLDLLEKTTDCTIDTLHLVGGGIQNELLNELTSATTEKTVFAGPVEATAIGNLLVQAKGCGELSSLQELREVVAKSFAPQSVEPPAGVAVSTFMDRYHELVSTTA